MKNRFQRPGSKLSKSREGRYGFDELSMFLNLAGLVLILLACIPHMQWLSVAALAVLILPLVRAMSRNHEKRREELNRYCGIRKKIRDRLFLWKTMRKERKTHVFFKCKNCRAVLRVPRGKGDIVVTCPKCRSRIEKHT